MLQTFNNARSFLSRVLPWAPEEEGTYKSIHWTFKPKDKTDKLLTGGSSQSLDDLMSMVQQEAGRADVYVALGSFKTADVSAKTASGRDRRWHKPVRLQTNISTIKTLYVDLDVSTDPKKEAYRSVDDAIEALGKFIQDSKLPSPSIIVASGTGGFHIYWVLERALTIQQWQPLALALADATKTHNLLCDRGVTVDSARILRVPDTFNWKTGLPLPVTLVRNIPTNYSHNELLQALTPYMMASASPTQQAAVVSGMAAKFAAGVDEASSPPVDIRDTALRCKVFEEALTTGGKDFGQPLWHLTMLASAFAVDGRQVAHEMSKGHKDYTPKETDEMFDRKVKERHERGLGWPKCATISRESKHCQTCPHFPANKTPFHYGVTPAQALPPEDDLPVGYFRGANNNTIWTHTTDKDGEPTSFLVLPYGITDAWSQEDPNFFHFTLHLPDGEKRKSAVDCNFLSSSHELGRVLPGMGIYVKEQQIKLIREFFVAFQHKLQEIKEKKIKTSPFGWTTIDGRIGFTYGGKTWFSSTESIPSAQADAQLGRIFQPKGAIQPWLDAVKIITDQKHPALEAILAASFAGPLVALTGHSGLLISAYSRGSGKGKTTTMRTAQAVWAEPWAGMNGLDDTKNSSLNKIGELKSLPLLWDELKTDEQIDQFVKLVFQLGQGVEKSRLRADTSQRKRGVWNTLMVAACNESLLDAFVRVLSTTDAGLYRVFEFEVEPRASALSPSGVEATIAKMRENYGNAGLIYAQYLGENHGLLRQTVLHTSATLEDNLGRFQNERFWIASMSCILVGAGIAKSLGLVDFDMQGLKNFLFDTLELMRKERKRAPIELNSEDAAEDILGQFFTTIRASRLLITDRTLQQAGRPRVPIKVLNRDPSKLQDVCAQLSISDGILRITSTSLGDFCRKEKRPRQMLIRELEKRYGMRTTSGKLGGGTGIDFENPFALKLVEIELSKQMVQKLISGVVLNVDPNAPLTNDAGSDLNAPKADAGSNESSIPHS